MTSPLKDLVRSIGTAPGDGAPELFLLADLSQAFAQSLDVEETLRHAADRILAFLEAEAASLFLLDEATNELVCRASAGPAPITGLRLPVGVGIVGRALTQGTWQMVRDARNDPDFFQAVDRETNFTTRSVMCAPLQVRERTFGVLEVLNKRGEPGLFSDQDLQTLRVLAAAVSLAIHNAQMASVLVSQKRIRQELELAREMQQRLLPPRRPGPFPLVGVNLPAHEVSGDFFDYFEVDGGRIGFTIGDVSGKGLNAALLMVRTTSLLRALGRAGLSLTKLLRQVNAELCETGSHGMFVCVFAGIYEPATGKVTWANAGFPPGLHRTAAGEFIRLRADAPPLGVDPDTTFHEHRFMLDGGALYLYTDGVTEARDASGAALEEAGLRRLIGEHAARPAEARLDGLMEALQALALRDDTTLLLLEPGREPAVERLAELSLRAHPEQLRHLRQTAAEALRGAGCSPALVMDVVLALDEACANVIRHAYCGDADGRIDLAIERRGDELQFVLRDYAECVDPARVKPQPPGEMRPGGLGMHFIDTIMDRWEFRRPPDGRGNLLVMSKTIG